MITPKTGTLPIRIVVADDHPITRYALDALLMRETDFIVIGEAANGWQVLERVAALDPDILMLDLRMPILDGFSTLQILRESNNRTKAIVLTASEDKTDFVRCMKLGAADVIRKQTPPRLIVNIIRAVHSRESWLNSEIVPDALRRFAYDAKCEAASSQQLLQRKPVSARELKVIQLIAQGLRNKEIADRLFISEQTVKNHLYVVFGKLGISDRLSLALYAIHEGLYTIGPERAVDVAPHKPSLNLDCVA